MRLLKLLKRPLQKTRVQQKLSVPERQKLAQQSSGKVLTLLDLSEVQLDGAATLVLTFSIPLDPDQDFSRVIHVVDKKKRQSGWCLGAVR
ncbi:putative protease inhibitor [Escherichia coli]|nr:putative protease inhibitor [Escherichia coli]